MNKKRIIIPLHQTDLAQLRQILTVCENYARKNTDTVFEFLHSKDTPVSVEDIRKEKTVAALEKSNQVFVSDKTAGIPAEIITDQVWLVKPESIHLLGPFREWLQKNPIGSETVYIGKAVGESKASLKKNLGGYIKQLAGGEGAETEIAVMSTSLFEVLAASIQNETGDALFNIVYAASHSAYTIKKLAFNTARKRGAHQGIFSYVKQRIAAFINWNIKVPAKQSFSAEKSGIEITNGKHPFYRLSFVALGLFLLVAIPYLSFDYGMIWDEKSENEYSKDVLNYYLTSGKDTTCFDTSKPLYSHQINYGTFINLAATVANKYFSPFGEYETRHLIVAFLSVLGIIFTGRVARKLTNPAIGTLAMLFLLISPHYFGQGMNNHKDIPFAAGYIISIYYLLCFLQQLPRPSATLITKLILAFGFTISVRIGGLLLIAYLVMFVGIYWLYLIKQNGSGKAGKSFIQLLKPILIIGIISYFIGILFWPWGMRAPLTNPIKALTEFTKYSNIKNYELFEGKILFMTDKPWYYLPKHMFINTPLYIWLGLALVIALIPIFIKKYNTRFASILAFVALFPIAYAVYKHSSLYNGWRQFIFTYPPLVVLSAMGFGTLLSLTSNKVYRIAVTVFIFLNLGYIAVWMIRNHPQEYVYFNETVGGVKGAYGNYELDYYSNSCREAAEWVANHEPGKKILVGINNEPLTASYYSSKINPDMTVQWVREYEEEKTNWDYLILTTRTFSKNELLNGSFPPKGTVYEVTSGGAPICVVVKRENNFMPEGYKALERKQSDSAIYFFSKAVEYNDKDEEAYRMLGYSYLTKGSFDSAELYTNKAIEIFPENYSAYHNKGLVYYSRKDLNKAIEFFDKATQIKINHTESYYYAATCEMQQNNFQGAIVHLKKAIEQNAGVPEFYYNLGLAYYNTGSFKKAEESLTACLSLNPKNALGYRLLAEIFNKENKQQEAQFCMQKYHELSGQ